MGEKKKEEGAGDFATECEEQSAREKAKMAARNLSEKDLRQMREAAEAALHTLNDLLGLNVQQTLDPPGKNGKIIRS